MTEPTFLNNDDRLTYLTISGKKTLEGMAGVGQGFSDMVVCEDMEGKIDVAILQSMDDDVVARGLAEIATKPRAMISLTTDTWYTLANAGYGIGMQGREGAASGLRPREMFALGMPGVTEALQVIVAFAGDDDVVMVTLPYVRKGKLIEWGEQVRHDGVNGKLAGAVRTAVTVSHARMS